MEVLQDFGSVVLSNGSKICIDPSRKPNCSAVISHAHSDHISAFKRVSKKLLLSNETASLLSSPNAELVKAPFSKKIEFEGFGLSLESSCHILGSSQIVCEGEKKVVITSDFQLQPSLILPEAEIHSSDVLVIESTFGMPFFQFPKRENVYEQIGSFIKDAVKQKKFVVLSGYALGKAQELVKIVNEFSGEVPLLHEKVFAFSKIYEENSAKLGKFELLDNNLKDFNVLILPPQILSKSILEAIQYSIKRKVVSGFCTGWNFRFKFYDKVFSLSDHADFQQLLRYVKESDPKMVFTMHGFARELSRSIQRRLKINSRPLSEKGQKSIAEYL